MNSESADLPKRKQRTHEYGPTCRSHRQARVVERVQDRIFQVIATGCKHARAVDRCILQGLQAIWNLRSPWIGRDWFQTAQNLVSNTALGHSFEPHTRLRLRLRHRTKCKPCKKTIGYDQIVLRPSY